MNIDKQALREVAERVNSGDWSYEEFNRLDLPGGSFVKIDGRDAVYCLNKPVGGIKQSRAVIAFIATFNPKVALALLDEIDELQERRKVAEPELNLANLANKFYERYPLPTFKSDSERAEAFGYFMAGAELQCFGEFIKYEELLGDE
ncbi:ead/Ea22-like family protein [Salmonella enterica]|nr:hypothetical protein [Salmonella enterica subsp. enterica serovar Newport]EKO1887564.1 ead/Ea22-like family protein [Salmonella enterica]